MFWPNVSAILYDASRRIIEPNRSSFLLDSDIDILLNGLRFRSPQRVDAADTAFDQEVSEENKLLSSETQNAHRTMDELRSEEDLLASISNPTERLEQIEQDLAQLLGLDRLDGTSERLTSVVHWDAHSFDSILEDICNLGEGYRLLQAAGPCSSHINNLGLDHSLPTVAKTALIQRIFEELVDCSTALCLSGRSKSMEPLRKGGLKSFRELLNELLCIFDKYPLRARWHEQSYLPRADFHEVTDVTELPHDESKEPRGPFTTMVTELQLILFLAPLS
jgi:hypothetical protein